MPIHKKELLVTILLTLIVGVFLVPGVHSYAAAGKRIVYGCYLGGLAFLISYLLIPLMIHLGFRIGLFGPP